MPGAERTGRSISQTRRRRRLIFTSAWCGAFFVLILAGVAWLGYRASTINTELNAANTLVSQLRDDILKDDAQAATVTVANLKEHTSRARDAASDPLWTMSASMPWLGANFQAVSQVATSADDVAQLGAAPLVSIFQTLDWESLVTGDQGLNLKPLSAAEPKLVTAAHAVSQSSDRLNGINTEDLLPQVSGPLVRVREELSSLRKGLNSAADAANLLPAMSGDSSPRRYLLLIQNNAESRSTGGIPGALAVLTVEKGKLFLGSQTSASAMGVFSPAVTVDPDQTAIYSARLGKFMQDVNLTPDFPTAAQTAQRMWKTRTGEELDGVLSMDPVALGYLLAGTGPVRITDPLLVQATPSGLPLELTAKNVVPTLLSDVYKRISEPSLQDVYFAGVAKEVFAKLSAGTGDTAKLIEGITRGAAEHRIQVWSTRADEQAVISQYPLGGSVTGSSISPAQFGVYFNDGTGAKMDYYVKRTVQLVEECPANGYSEVKVLVTSTNAAPKDAAESLPDYVTGGGVFGVPAGSVQTNVTAYGPVQSNIETASVDGKKTGFASYGHGGRPVGALTVRLEPGESSTVEFTFGKIVQHTLPQLSVTPTIQSQNEVVLATRTAACDPAA
ncbi:DUF4012 domain-containing protein [Arthrobacter sp. NPDC056727]|uniref:DUF4012 domain-containing protein n=1 Tax=Arthrobacter sp. NPDC056727 TaxID=3345927 RepID=UPI0036707F8A